jgi:erythromycin esterase-like protein
VEGDWLDCDRVDCSVRCQPGAPDDPRAALAEFERWPTWLWANEEVVDFCYPGTGDLSHWSVTP